MRNECNIIRDILPLYAEKMVSPDTADFVEEHMARCAECRDEYSKMKEPEQYVEDNAAAPLAELSRRLRIKRIQTVVMTAAFVIAILVSVFAVLDAPEYLPYSDKTVTAEAVGDEAMLLTFDKSATDYDYDIYKDPNGGEFYYCEVEAWTSTWDRIFSKADEPKTLTVRAKDSLPIVALYVPNDGTQSVCIARFDPNAEVKIGEYEQSACMTVLPRLVLGYYLAAAAAALTIAAVVWLLTRKKDSVRVWAERIGLYPAAYIISHFAVTGFKNSTYAVTRDLCLIVCISILLYCGFLLLHSLIRRKRETRLNK
ncbi:MAG: zf-HC2 domain-containing protein [Clostridia bacterium]|nr:zf-HC2 domain-containing protein [Clostridia bacterium]